MRQVVGLTKAAAEALPKGGKAAVVAVYAPWCKFCQGMEDEFNKFAAGPPPAFLLPPSSFLLPPSSFLAPRRPGPGAARCRRAAGSGISASGGYPTSPRGNHPTKKYPPKPPLPSGHQPSEPSRVAEVFLLGTPSPHTGAPQRAGWGACSG